MKENYVLLCGMTKTTKELKKELNACGIVTDICQADNIAMHKKCLEEKPYAIIVEDGICEYDSFVNAVSNWKSPPQIFILADTLTLFKPTDFGFSNVHILENKYDTSKIVKSIKTYTHVEINNRYQYLSKRLEICSEIIYRLFLELNFTPDLTGSIHLKNILLALCTNELKKTDSMTKVIYPYAATKLADSTAYRVERNIRTIAKKCWLTTTYETRVKYFGSNCAGQETIPTNKVLIMVLSDYVNRETDILMRDDEEKSKDS